METKITDKELMGLVNMWAEEHKEGDLKPYIEYVGNGLFAINGDDKFVMWTGIEGAKQALIAFEKEIKKYGN